MNKRLVKKNRAVACKEALRQTEEQRLKELARITEGKPVSRSTTVVNPPKKDRKSIPDPNIILKAIRELNDQVCSLNSQVRELTKCYGSQIDDLRKEQKDLFYGKLREGLKNKKTQKAQITYIKNLIGTKSLAPTATERFGKRVGGFVPVIPEV